MSKPHSISVRSARASWAAKEYVNYRVSASLTKQEIKAVREAFTRSLSADFKNYAIGETLNDRKLYGDGVRNALPLDSHTYQTHHIIPRMLGGNNDFSNLTLVHPRLHKAIHKYIRDQDSRNGLYLIPVYAGLIWGPR